MSRKRAGKNRGMSTRARQSLRERRRFKRRAKGLGDMYRRMSHEHGMTVRQCMDTGFSSTLRPDAGVEVIRQLARECSVRALDVAYYVRNRCLPQSIIDALAPTPLPSGERRAQFLGQEAR
jgi:hypothetical protein